tara:strand:- start:461 stop:646 length:186 start_codon:yes stop_codon:yes gene_type:complete
MSHLGIIKETYYGDYCVTYYRGLKCISIIKDGQYRKFRYSSDTTTKNALRHFKAYLKGDTK